MMKLIKRAGLIILTAIMVVSVAGCERIYTVGDTFYELNPSTPMIISSINETFPIDDVGFALSFGLYNLDDAEKSGVEKEKEQYRQSEDENIIVGIYACDNDHRDSEEKIYDIEHIKDYYLLRLIPEEEAFSDDLEYGYRMSLSGNEYNHTEPITIPKEVFTKDNGAVAVVIIVFVAPEKDGEEYRISNIHGWLLRYEKSSNGKKVKFKYTN